MSVYYCNRCDTYQDDDYVVCVEDPKVEFGLMCEEHLDDEDESADQAITKAEGKANA